MFHTPLKESIEIKSTTKKKKTQNEIISNNISINSAINNNIEKTKKTKILNKYNYFFKNNQDNINASNSKFDVISKLVKIMADEGSSYEYINSVIVLFEKYFNYIITKNKKIKTKTLITKNIDKCFIVKNIDLKEVYEFLNDKRTNNYSSTSLCNIFSRMRKFIRILNKKKSINYKVAIPKIIKENNTFKLTKDDLTLICEEIKSNHNLQMLLIFYFLYFTGLTFSKVSRIKITDFKSDFSILVEKKEKFKKYIIPHIIRNLLLYFIKSKKNNSLFLFYDSIKDTKDITRAQLIKNNISNTIKECKDFSKIKSLEIIKSFSKKRSSKRLSGNLYFLFNINLNFFDNNNSNKDINNEGINNSNNNLFLEQKELPENKEYNFSISQLSNNNLIEYEEFQENDNNIFSNSFSEIYESSIDKINDLEYGKQLDFGKNIKDLKFLKNKKKRCLVSNFISISNDSNKF